MELIKTDLEGLLLLNPDVHKDQRGYFLETFTKENYKDLGIRDNFVQDNLSKSIKGTLRGLHYQLESPQAKLVRVVRGKVFDVAVDIRSGSDTFGKHFSVVLDDLTNNQLYIPKGFAHGFCVISEEAIFEYKCSDYYEPNDQLGLIWNDPSLEIDWPIERPLISLKDQKLPSLSSVKSLLLPKF
ncbi:dTDP-4-dehydrorhamnose 3,5-epimerase [Gammaproteobacteria bacterium]|nr:dTDP-4-dehydrorhamnose 3,5-epimerase [Gammaproteobacteria bacterium]